LSLKLIVAMTKDRVIGKGNKMPWQIDEDLAYFKALTMGGAVIMGKRTYESIGRPLPGRTNVVLSRNPDFKREKLVSLTSLQEAIQKFPDAFIIGGANVFKQALPLVEIMYITQINAEIPGDTMFPIFDASEWDMEVLEKRITKSGYEILFLKYIRKKSGTKARDN